MSSLSQALFSTKSDSPGLPNSTPPSQARAAILAGEILEIIFFFIHPYPGEHGARLPSHLCSVTQVCSHWRNVALGRHRLWTSIEVVTDAMSMKQLDQGTRLLETILSRIGPILPLDITVIADPHYVRLASRRPYPKYDSAEVRLTRKMLTAASMYRYMSLIKPIRHRLRHLDLSFPIDKPCALGEPLPGTWPWRLDNMPELEFLSILYPSVGDEGEIGVIDLSACSAQIKECHFVGCLKICVAEGLVLKNLVNIEVDLFGSHDGVLVTSLYDVLQKTPGLKKLSVTTRAGLDWSHRHNQPCSSIHLPQLEKLQVIYPMEMEWSPVLPYLFLNDLRCKGLRDLKISCEYYDAPGARGEFQMQTSNIGLFRFLYDNGGKLEQLVIGADLFYEYELKVALVRCRNLRCLHFNGVRFAEDSDLLKVLHLPFSPDGGSSSLVHVPYCPRLESLKVTNCHIPLAIKKTDVMDMIVGRLEKEGSRLKYFEFARCNLEDVCKDPRIQTLREGPVNGLYRNRIKLRKVESSVV